MHVVGMNTVAVRLDAYTRCPWSAISSNQTHPYGFRELAHVLSKSQTPVGQPEPFKDKFLIGQYHLRYLASLTIWRGRANQPPYTLVPCWMTACSPASKEPNVWVVSAQPYLELCNVVTFWLRM